MSSLKPKSKILKPAQIQELANEQWRQNNPNSSNYYGSTTTTFDGDQANITQQYSEPVQQLVDQRMAFLAGGPQQMQPFSNPFMEQMIGNSANNVSRRAGNPKPMGSINSTPQAASPQMAPSAYGPPSPSGPNGLPTVEAPQQDSFMQNIVPALENIAGSLPTNVNGGGGYGGGGMSTQISELMKAISERQRRKQQDYEFRGL